MRKDRKQNRLKEYDYSQEGLCFITICSKNREEMFSIINEHDAVVGTALAAVRNEVPVSIELTDVGMIIDRQWNDIVHRYENVSIDDYVIMPNHIHGILIIDQRTGASPVPTLSNIIGAFKSKSAGKYLKFIKQNDLNISGKIWQRSFYDHIIRDEKDLNRIRTYIRDNSANWLQDENNINKKR